MGDKFINCDATAWHRLLASPIFLGKDIPKLSQGPSCDMGLGSAGLEGERRGQPPARRPGVPQAHGLGYCRAGPSP